MVIADTGAVGGLLGSILDQSRWCITNLHIIVVWASNNVFPLQTGHAAEDNDDKRGDEMKKRNNKRRTHWLLWRRVYVLLLQESWRPYKI